MPRPISHKVWFITGASKGFGYVWTEAALARGDRVAAAARNIGALDALKAKYGDRLLPLALDVGNKAAVWITRRRECTRRSRDQRVHRNPVTGVTPIVRYPAPIYFSDHQPKCRIKSGTNDKGVKGDDEARERGIA
jgi:hypothetical protein